MSARPAPPPGKSAAWVNGWCVSTGYKGGGWPPAENSPEYKEYHAGLTEGMDAIKIWLSHGNRLT